MKILMILSLLSILIFSSCSNNSNNPVNTTTTPTAPVLVTPTDASTGIAVIPTLKWNASSGATSYMLQISVNSSFSSFVFNQGGLTNLTQQISGLNPLSIYYWRVSASVMILKFPYYIVSTFPV
jgi:PBP1b-binding outer membrane lipoprotein LpoB